SSGDALLSSGGYYTVERNGERLKIEIPSGFINSFSNEKSMSNFIDIRYPFDIFQIAPDGPASQTDLQQGDRIIAVNDREIHYFDELQDALDAYANQEVALTVQRGDEVLNRSVAVREDGTIGIAVNPLLEPVRKKYSFAESIPKGTERAFAVVILNAKAMGKMFTGEVSATNISGPIGIAKIYGTTWDWVKFWSMTGLISMILAFMNLLPIPALDGGHVVFLL